MNILFLLRLWPVYGGGETVTIALANEFVKRGHQVFVLYFKDSDKPLNIRIDNRIISYKMIGIRCDEFKANKGDSRKVELFLNEYVSINKIDVVINQWWPIYYLKEFKKYSSTLLINCLHTAFYTPNLSYTGVKGVIKRCVKPLYIRYKKWNRVNYVNQWLSIVDKFVFLSYRFQDEYMKMSGNDNQNRKLTSIPNPLVYPNQIKQEDLILKNDIVLYVGRMTAEKNVGKALNAWYYIEQEDDLKEWKFILVGEGPDLASYKNQAMELGLKRVSFEGYAVPEDYYRRAKIFVMTSDFEGWPMTLVESLQNGVVPIVMDNFLSLHDIIVNNSNGLIVSNDIDEFSKALASLMRNEKRLLEMSKNGLELSKQFSVQNIADQWEVLFSE